MTLDQAVNARDYAVVETRAANATPEQRADALLVALRIQDDRSFELILRHPCALDRVVRNDFALAAAARTGRIELVRPLLDAGANIDQHVSCWWERSRDEGRELCRDGVSALFEAVRYDRRLVVDLLVERGVAINQLGTQMRTAHDLAVELGHCVDLLERGGGRGRRPEDLSLTQAAQLGLIERLEQFVDTATSAELSSALDNAALNNHDEAVRFLIAKGVAITPGGVLESKSRYVHLPTLEALLAGGADPNVRGLSSGELPLGAAAGAGQLEAARALLSHGARVDGLDLAGLPALHHAIAGGHAPLVELLLAEGGDPLVADGIVRHTLAKLPEPQRITMLEQIGAHTDVATLAFLAAAPEPGTRDPTAPRPRGDIRAMIAKVQTTHQLAELVRAGNTGYAALTQAAAHGADLAMTDDEGEWLRDGDGQTLLHLAARAGAPSLVRQGIAAGIAADVRDDHGCTPLHRARTAEIVAILVDAGVDPMTRDRRERTPLHTSTSAAATRALLELGADPNALDGDGEPPWLHHLVDTQRAALEVYRGAGVDFSSHAGVALYRAALANQARTVELLLDAGLDPQTRHAGQRVADVARFANQLDALAVLVAAGGDPEAEARTLAVDPKTTTLPELIDQLEVSPLLDDTLAELHAGDELQRLLAAAIEMGDTSVYLDALWARWADPWDLAPAFRAYVEASATIEFFGRPGASPWRLWGVAEAQLRAASMAEALGSSTAGLAELEFPGLPVGESERGDLLWLVALEGEWGQRGGSVLTTRAHELRLAAREHARLEPGARDTASDGAGARRLRHELVSRLCADHGLLDIVDLVYLAWVAQAGEIPAEHALRAVMRWDDQRLERARRVTALDFLGIA